MMEKKRVLHLEHKWLELIELEAKPSAPPHLYSKPFNPLPTNDAYMRHELP